MFEFERTSIKIINQCDKMFGCFLPCGTAVNPDCPVKNFNPSFRPKTQLVKNLLKLRKTAIDNGMKLLSTDEILKQKHNNRL